MATFKVCQNAERIRLTRFPLKQAKSCIILSLYYINQPENISKTSVRTSVTHAAIVPHFLILPHFDVIFDHTTEQMLGSTELSIFEM